MDVDLDSDGAFERIYHVTHSGGENFDQGTGVVTIAVIAAVVLILGCLLAAFFTRSRARARAMRRRPDSQGHAGRVGEFRSR